MSIFAPIRKLLAPPAPSKTEANFSLPYDLSPGDWAKLKTLTSDPGWEVFVRSLDAIVKLSGEQILQSSSDSALHFLRGKVSGLRKAASLVDEIAVMEKRFVNERNEHAKRAERNRESGVLFGTPGWRTKRND